MGKNSDVFLRMSEEYYLSIPNEILSGYLHSKRVDEETSDWAENMTDDTFSSLYKKKKEISKQLEERQYQLREQRRKINNIEVNL